MNEENQYNLFDGIPPHERLSATSRMAAESMRPHIGGLRQEVLRVIKERPATCDEIEVALGGRHQSISARVRELYILGEIVDTGIRRRTRSGRLAVVWGVI